MNYMVTFVESGDLGHAYFDNVPRKVTRRVIEHWQRQINKQLGTGANATVLAFFPIGSDDDDEGEAA